MHTSVNPIKKVLVSVWDKTGLDTLAPLLKSMNVQVYSTGGTAKHLEGLGLKVTQIDEVTQFPEMLAGRVKTLHPKVFGGILARREEPEDLKQVEQYQIPLFDLVIVNLYPFWDHLNESPKEQSQFIDIGGPSMIRASAKNHWHVTVASDPQDYAELAEELKKYQGTSYEFRKKMAALTFERTSRYDAMVANAWRESALPKSIDLSLQTPLRYGENPHQKAAWCGKADWETIQGKELSYNNLLDCEAACRLTAEFSQSAVAIIKHNNPCGVASFDGSLSEVYTAALNCDPKSAFGGIVSFNKKVDAETSELLSQHFFEVIVAPDFDAASLETFSKKKNLRIIRWAKPVFQPFEIRSSMGGFLVQSQDDAGVPSKLEKVTSEKSVTKEVEKDLVFAWLVSKHVRSNAIVIAKNGRTLGVGAGQMSRVDAVEIALKRAGSESRGAVLASDAFFPFRDNIDLLKGKEIAAIVQPGGSQRDGEVIQACNELGISMFFTGQRHFRH